MAAIVLPTSQRELARKQVVDKIVSQSIYCRNMKINEDQLLTPATEESKDSMEETEVAAAGGAATPKYLGTLPVWLPSWLTT